MKWWKSIFFFFGSYSFSLSLFDEWWMMEFNCEMLLHHREPLKQNNFLIAYSMHECSGISCTYFVVVVLISFSFFFGVCLLSVFLIFHFIHSFILKQKWFVYVWFHFDCSHIFILTIEINNKTGDQIKRNKHRDREKLKTHSHIFIRPWNDNNKRTKIRFGIHSYKYKQSSNAFISFYIIICEIETAY